MSLAFGPIPSRRLGQSLGINNVPYKVCSYSCVYCQLGATIRAGVERRVTYPPDRILEDVRSHLSAVRARGEKVDFLTFVPDGEPTLDAGLGRAIDLLRPLGIPIAVITNSSLLWLEEVRQDLSKADYVCLKVDSAREDLWRRINRPHPDLSLARILEGAVEFARGFKGTLATETMLVAGLNDAPPALEETAEVLARLRPAVAYVAVPTRPPAESWVRRPDESAINAAVQLLSRKVRAVEHLIGYEGDAFASTGNAREDFLSITAVHPMREDAVRALVGKSRSDPALPDRLVEEGLLARTAYEGHTFYVRRIGA